MVTGKLVEACILLKQSATKLGSFIKQAPNLLFSTFLLGQPKFKLISSYPKSSPNLEASAKSFGEDPPN